MSTFKNPYKSMNELVESLIKENEELKLKLNNIEEFYQGRINRLMKMKNQMKFKNWKMRLTA